MNVINGIKDWATERQIDKMEFKPEVEIVNILEELFEMTGVDSQIARGNAEFIYEREFLPNQKKVSKEDLCDALNDVIVFSTTAIMKLGYNPELTLNEVLKEISSRKQDPKQKEEWELNGIPDGAKWQKDLSQDKSTLYKADFSKCLLKDK